MREIAFEDVQIGYVVSVGNDKPRRIERITEAGTADLFLFYGTALADFLQGRPKDKLNLICGARPLNEMLAGIAAGAFLVSHAWAGDSPELDDRITRLGNAIREYELTKSFEPGQAKAADTSDKTKK